MEPRKGGRRLWTGKTLLGEEVGELLMAVGAGGPLENWSVGGSGTVGRLTYTVWGLTGDSLLMSSCRFTLSTPRSLRLGCVITGTKSFSRGRCVKLMVMLLEGDGMRLPSTGCHCSVSGCRVGGVE